MGARNKRINIMLMKRVLAFNIRRYREDRDMSQAELGHCIHMTQQQVSMIEIAGSYVHFCTVMAIAHVLQVNAAMLMKPPEDLSLLPARVVKRRSVKHAEVKASNVVPFHVKRHKKQPVEGQLSLLESIAQ